MIKAFWFLKQGYYFVKIKKGTLQQKVFNCIQLVPYIKSAYKISIYEKMTIGREHATEALTT